VAGNATDTRRSVISKLSVILLAFNKGGAYTISELAEHTGLPVSTTHRLATELAEWQVLERSDDRRFRPGQSLRTLGGTTCCTTSTRDRAAPVMEDLSRAAGTDIRLGLLDQLSVSYIHKSHRQPVSQFSPAATLPLHATAMGKVLLAFSPAPVVNAFLGRKLRAYTTHTITDADRFRWTLKVIRAHRLAVSDRELRLDHVAVAAPVFGLGGHIVASLEVMVKDLSKDLQHAGPALAVAAGSLTRELERPCCICTARGVTDRLPAGFAAVRRPGALSIVHVSPTHDSEIAFHDNYRETASHRVVTGTAAENV
jgi:DNA-binding IclR family transcriptional regulator